MGGWFEKFRRKMDKDITASQMMNIGAIGTQSPTLTPTITASAAYTVSTGMAPGIIGNVAMSGQYNMGNVNFKAPNIIEIRHGGKDIVKMAEDGSVIWANGYNVDEAAEAFSQVLYMSVELSAGITKRVKSNMRDSIFNDIISIAKDKGSLSAEDLTYLLEASKIVEKLKGGRNDT